MYLVSLDYLNKNERPSQLSTSLLKSTKPRKSSLIKTAHSTKHKTRARVTKKKKKKSLHPYKWIATRAKIEEAAEVRKALIKAIADFMKAVLPETTLTQRVLLPKIESSAQTTDILPIRRSPLPLVLPQTTYETESPLVLPPTSYETETSPGIVRTSDDDDVAGGISEGDETSIR
jgi:hypothetical protein